MKLGRQKPDTLDFSYGGVWDFLCSKKQKDKSSVLDFSLKISY